MASVFRQYRTLKTTCYGLTCVITLIIFCYVWLQKEESDMSGHFQLFGPRPVKSHLSKMEAFYDTLKLVLKNRQNEDYFGGDRYCNDSLEVVGSHFIYMKNVVINSDRWIKYNARQNLSSEVRKVDPGGKVFVKPGFFELRCEKIPKLNFRLNPHFKQWITGLGSKDRKGVMKSILLKDDLDEISNFVVLVKRRDYSNLYHVFIDLYNAFLTVKLFIENPKTSTVIFMDSYPAGELDTMWKTLFGNIIRIGDMKGSVKIKGLAWGVFKGPLSEPTKHPPYLKQFKYSVLKEFKVSIEKYGYCPKTANETRVTLILSRKFDSFSNFKGVFSNKSTVRDNVISTLKHELQIKNVQLLFLDRFRIKDQIRKISSTDVLIGFHGVGLAHGFLLKAGSAMIEIFPKKYILNPKLHFRQVARWGKLSYYPLFSSYEGDANETIFISKEVTRLIRTSINDVNKFCSRVNGGDWCNGELDGVYKTQYCDIGGCCLEDGSKWYKNNDASSDLCCISSLTVVLIAIFIGGPVLLMTCICAVCCIKWCIKKKNKRVTRINSSISDDGHFDPKDLRIRTRLGNADLMLPAYTPNPPPYKAYDDDDLPGAMRTPPPAYSRPDTTGYNRLSASAARNNFNQPSTSRSNYNQPSTSRSTYNQPSTSRSDNSQVTVTQVHGTIENLEFI